MLGVGRYLLGVAEIGVLVGFAWSGAAWARARLLPEFEGAPAHLATAVLALALLLWVAELLGTVGLFEAGPYLVVVALIGGGVWALGRGSGHRGAARGSGVSAVALIALAIAAIAVVHFAAGVRPQLSTGMTGFDSTWYHGPFAAGFFQSGDTWSLHFIAPQFLAWFYPANSEVFHAVGMVAFGRDILSPLLNFGWFVGCLVACWCVGRPYRLAPFSLGLGAIALSVPALADQAGEARNDIVGIFFLLAAVAIALHAWEGRSERGLSTGAIAFVGLSVGLAAGTKLNFLLPAAVLVVGLGVIAPTGGRWRALWIGALATLAGGGYWYLRNLAHAGNPLPWIHHLGPISLPSPGQGLGGREAHDVLGYLTDGSVWSDWLFPGLHHGLWVFWPLLMVLSLAALVLCLRRSAGSVLRVAGLAGLAVVFAWLIAPTSASGPDGMPRGFESGLRYLAPALVLGIALLPVAPPLRKWLGSLAERGPRLAWKVPAWVTIAVGATLVVLAVGLGYPVQRHYLQNRYSDPSFTNPGLNVAFKWARGISGAKIAVTSTRQYPFFGTDLSNRVEFVGRETAHGGFRAPATCSAWRRLLNAGDYDYVVASRDRVEPGELPFPDSARWMEPSDAEWIVSEPPTAIYRLVSPLNPLRCQSE